MNIRSMPVILAVLFAVVVLLFGCQKTYYAVWEKLGKEKRHLLRDNVQKANKEQKAASEQFKDTLARMRELYGFEGGELEDLYEKLKAEYEASEERADVVRVRIATVEEIADDLFSEWQKEIKEIKNKKLQPQSSQSLRASKQQYARFHTAMKKAEARMDPVLAHFKDNVLYLKHNLNAQAVGALKKEAGEIEHEVETLIANMQKSIEEAEAFLRSFQ